MLAAPDLPIPHITIAMMAGFVSGFLVSFPVGPVNLTILNEGARRGFQWAALIGTGASVMETLYCAVAFMGFSAFFTHRTVKAVVELISFLLMLFLGIKFLRAPALEERNPIEDRIEERLHPHSAFMIGFVRVLGNPGVLLLWITLSAAFVVRDWVWPTTREKLACVGGVFLGTTTWFLLLSFAVSRGHGKFSRQTLLRVEHVSGACLLLIALVLAVRLVLLIERR